MKRIFKFIFIIFLALISVNKVNALSVSENNIIIKKGESKNIELYANVTDSVTSVEFTLVFTTYDIPAYFAVNPNYQDQNPDGIKHKIVFPEAVTGQILLGTVSINVKNNPNDLLGTINIHSAKATNVEETVINLNSQNINVTVGTTETTEEPPKENKDPNLLEKIESKIVEIKLEKDVFEYTVKVKSEVEELDLKPVAKDTNSKVEISTQKIAELTDNKIIITVKNNDIEQKYTINIEKLKEEVKPEINIDEEEFHVNDSYRSKWLIATIIFIVVFMIGLLLTKKK